MQSKYLIVDKAMLPPIYSKVARVKELLDEGKADGVSEAVRIVGISRSTYYKYRDRIGEYNPVSSSGYAVVSMLLRDEIGALANLVSLIAENGFNIWTVTQNPPVDSKSRVVILLNLVDDNADDLDLLLSRIQDISSVSDFKLQGFR